MIELLFVSALGWPSECLAMGELYRSAAIVRDRGVPLEHALEMTNNGRIKTALRHVYDEPTMTPRDWKMFSIGVCIGAIDLTIPTEVARSSAYIGDDLPVLR
jgi:hypothetical protein